MFYEHPTKTWTQRKDAGKRVWYADCIFAPRMADAREWARAHVRAGYRILSVERVPAPQRIREISAGAFEMSRRRH